MHHIFNKSLSQVTCDSCTNKESISAFQLDIRIELNCIGVSRLVEIKLHTRTIKSMLPKMFLFDSSDQFKMQNVHQVKKDNIIINLNKSYLK
jgi:hypothetical protein